MSWHSQFSEDRWLAENRELPAKGYFVEVGAYDGISCSNTLAFEEMGWEGMCFEPDPEIAELCRKNRKAMTYQTAIGGGGYMQPFWVNDADRGTSSLIKYPNTRDYGVTVNPLWKFLDLWRPPSFDLLSIDTEGTELEVWSTRGPWNPTYAIVEFWTQPQPPRFESIVARFEVDGYRLIHQTEANAIFQIDPKPEPEPSCISHTYVAGHVDTALYPVPAEQNAEPPPKD